MAVALHGRTGLAPRVSEINRDEIGAIGELAATLHRKIPVPAFEDPPPSFELTSRPGRSWYGDVPPFPAETCLQMRFLAVQILLLPLRDWQQPKTSRAAPFSQINPAILHVLQSRTPVKASEAAHLCGLNISC